MPADSEEDEFKAGSCRDDLALKTRIHLEAARQNPGRSCPLRVLTANLGRLALRAKLEARQKGVSGPAFASPPGHPVRHGGPRPMSGAALPVFTLEIWRFQSLPPALYGGGIPSRKCSKRQKGRLPQKRPRIVVALRSFRPTPPAPFDRLFGDLWPLRKPQSRTAPQIRRVMGARTCIL